MSIYDYEHTIKATKRISIDARSRTAADDLLEEAIDDGWDDIAKTLARHKYRIDDDAQLLSSHASPAERADDGDDPAHPR
jgi:hypothetical protein